MNINNVKLGNGQVDKIYIGENITWLYEAPDTTPPVTTPYPTSTVEYDAGREIYFEVNETCFTYYTLDGSPVSEASTLYVAPIVLNETTTINYFSIDLAGNVETPKTVIYNIIAVAPTTTSISPTNTIQNSLPVTVTLTSSEGKTIYYKLGATGTQQTYAGSFMIGQSTAGVGSTQLKVTYWATGEAEQTLTYDSSGAIAGKPAPIATPQNGQVTLNWAATANTTSYNVYRSTVFGTIGTLLSEYQATTSYVDNTAANGVTYWYTVRGANYGNGQNSDQVEATPQAAQAPATYRYIRVQGYGDQTGGSTRIVEFKAMEGATNRLLNVLPMAGYAAVNGGTIGVATDGAIVHSAGYPLWWSGAGIPVLTYDLGAAYAIDTLTYVGYSPSWDTRQTKFKLFVSTNNVDWLTVTDQSLNTTAQPEAGFSYTVSFA